MWGADLGMVIPRHPHVFTVVSCDMFFTNEMRVRALCETAGDSGRFPPSLMRFSSDPSESPSCNRRNSAVTGALSIQEPLRARDRCAGHSPCKSPKTHISTRARGLCRRNGGHWGVLRHLLTPPQQEPRGSPPQGKGLGSLQEGPSLHPRGSTTWGRAPGHHFCLASNSQFNQLSC